MNAEVLMWVLIAAGMVPWWVSRRVAETGRGRRRRVEVEWRMRALFWRLTVRRVGRARPSWQLSIPLISRLADAVWSAVRKLVQ